MTAPPSRPPRRGGNGRAAPGERDAFVKDLRPAQDPSPCSPPHRACSAGLGPGTSWHTIAAIILLSFFFFFAVGVMTNAHWTPQFLRVSEWPLRVESRPTTPLTDARKLGTAHSPRAQPQTATPGPALPVLGVGAVSGQLALQVSEGHEGWRGPLAVRASIPPSREALAAFCP